MKHQLFELPITAAKGTERPSVTALHAQQDGSLLCGLSFCKPILFRIQKKGEGLDFEDLKMESIFGDDLLAVTNGLRSNTSGDTAFTLLHGGFLPEFLQGFAGGPVEKKAGAELLNFLFSNDGGMGAVVRHSIVQIIEGEVSVRRSKEPGALLDVAHIGDFVFGLAGTSIWKEPYLNSEKRETLRKDLGKNWSLHRDDDGTFWFIGGNSRLQRMGQTDIKAKPTVLKLPVAEFEISAATSTEGWLYGSTADSRELFRVRRNPVSFEEESQKVMSFDGRICAMVAVDREVSPLLAIAVEAKANTEIYVVDLIKPEDPELAPPANTPRKIGEIAGVACVSSLTLDLSDAAKSTVWGGESRLGCGKTGFAKTRLVQITEL